MTWIKGNAFHASSRFTAGASRRVREIDDTHAASLYGAPLYVCHQNKLTSRPVRSSVTGTKPV
jgi:hypothetical protein